MPHLTLKDTTREIKRFTLRTMVIIMGLLLLVLVLLSRLVYLQVIQHNTYTTLSNKNQLSLIPIEPTRGLIFDRNGVLLAKNIPVFSLDVIPGKVKHLKKTITALEKLGLVSDDDLQDFYKLLRQKRPFEPVPLRLRLNPQQVATFMVNRWRFPGVAVNARLMRYYPLGAALSHVVGFMGRINTSELAHVDPSNYSATNYIGKVGIEKYFESELHGTVGYQQVETDASGRIIRSVKRKPPVAGDDLYLTIDSKLEIAAEKALGKLHGAVVVVQPSTGEILALVSTPSYNPNQFVQGLSTKAYKKIENSPGQPLYNRAIRGLYAPGSTIKPFYALEGLYSGVITPSYTIHDPGYFRLPGVAHVYHDWNHSRGGHGLVNLKKAIVVSCDTYFYNLAVKLGISHLDDILRAFGFGHDTGIEMGEELPGIVPGPAWKLRTKGQHWYTGDTVITGIGQGYLLATPIQLAMATAALAERGQRMRPHIVAKIKTPDSSIIQQQPTPLHPVELPKKDWHLVIQAMQGVVRSRRGTGIHFGRNPPYTVAAKTGTAQVYSAKNHQNINNADLPFYLRDNSLFIAFAPVQDPKIAVAVVVEHSDAAARIARKVIDYYLLTEKQQEKTRVPRATQPPMATQPATNTG